MEEMETNDNTQNDNIQNNNTQNDQVSTKELLALMQALTYIQMCNQIILEQIFAREGKEQINDKVNGMKDKIMEQAKVFGQKVKKVEETYNLNKESKNNILQEYRESLAQIEEQYEIRSQAILQERSNCQEEEQATMLKEYELKQNKKQIKKSPQYVEQVKEEKALAKQIKKALDEGDLDTVTAKNEELKRLKAKNPLMKCDQEIEKIQQQREQIQQLISQCEKELVDCQKERYDSIEEVTQDKDNKLMEMKKQNIFQKITGAVMNKINGAKRFKDKVIKTVAEKIGYIKNEKYPEIKRSTSEKDSSFKEDMSERKNQVLDKDRPTKEQLMQRVAAKLRESIEQRLEPNIESSKEQNAQFRPSYADGAEK